MNSHIANKIEAKDKTLSEILFNCKYEVEYFQREYRWRRKHIEDLISDLSGSFLTNYKEGHTVDDIAKYNRYYLGPFVINDKSSSYSIVDGQQRLTSITLLLLYLNKLQQNIAEDEQRDLSLYLFYKKGTKRETLVLDVETRSSILHHLYENSIDSYNEEISDESVQNIVERYDDIKNLFLKELKENEVLPLFIEWLLEKVVMVEIKAFSSQNAYSIFETMNDRGLNLSPTEMLKSFLLANASDEFKIKELNELWRNKILALKSNGIESDVDFFKAWLRAKYAEKIRKTAAGAENEDFENIGTRFHTWVRENQKKIGLNNEEDFYYFVKSDFEFYSTLFNRIQKLQSHQTSGAEGVYISSFYKIADSLSFPLFMSSVTKLDDEDQQLEKIKLISNFIDNYTTLRTLKGRSITQSSIRNAMYELIKSIRNNDIISLKEELNMELEKNFDSSSDILPLFQIMNNWGYYHYFYARINYFLMQQSGNDLPDFSEMMRSRKRNSLVLYRFINEGEPDNDVEPQLWENYINSIFSFCLVRRYELDNLYEMSQCDRIKYLIENRYMPEMGGYDIKQIKPNYITEFLTNRGTTIGGMYREVWSF